MSIVAPQKNVPGALPGTENNNETPVQPTQTPTIPGSPPGTTYGHENDRALVQPEGGTVDPANREPAPAAPIAAPPAVTKRQ